MTSFPEITVFTESSLGNLGRVLGALPDARPAFFVL
jgi:hypothetical protein